MKIGPKCCGHKHHAQIEYTGIYGSVESLLGFDPTNPEDIEAVKEMLEEWLTRKRANNRPDDPDHFIVYRNWPKS
jgi:hypothetical protein